MQPVHVLVDLENNQPTLDDVKRLVPEVTHAWLFHSRSQVKRLASFAPLGAAQTPVPISRPGKNALDFHLAFYVGYIASRNPGARIVIVAIDRGYRPMIEHAVSLGFDVTQVPFKPAAATAAKKAAGRKAAAKKVTAKKVAAKKAAAKKASGNAMPGQAVAGGKTAEQAAAPKAAKEAAKKAAKKASNKSIAPKAASVKPDAGQAVPNKAPAEKPLAAAKAATPKGPKTSTPPKAPKGPKASKAPKAPKDHEAPPQAPTAPKKPGALNAPIAKEPAAKTRAAKATARQVPNSPSKRLPVTPKAPARPQAAAKPPAAEKVLANLRTMGEKLPKKLRQLRRYVSSMLGTGEADPAVGRVVDHLVASGFVRVNGEALAYGGASSGKSV